MTAKKDITGREFGRLRAIKDVGRNKHNQRLWESECNCGNKVVTTTTALLQGHTKSCGCLQKEEASNNTSKDLKGKRFGKLVVVKSAGVQLLGNGGKRRRWFCKCDCGGTKVTPTAYLTSGRTQSCGCIQREGVRERMSGENHYKFNPELTAEQRLKHRFVLGGDNATKWRKRVFDRDKYTCQLCNSRNGNGKQVILNAHHLDGWNWCKEKRFDTDNGITLCEDCHNNFHKKYGGGDNTKEQFEEFRTVVLEVTK